MFPTLLPATIEPVWCPVLGMDEEDALAQEELAFEQQLAAVRSQRGPRPIGVRSAKRGDEDEEEVEEEDDEEEEDMDVDDDEEEDDEDEEEEEEEEESEEESEASSGAVNEVRRQQNEDVDESEEDDERYDSDAW